MNKSNPKQATTDTSSKLAVNRRNDIKQNGFKSAIIGGPQNGRPRGDRPQYEDGADDIFY